MAAFLQSNSKFYIKENFTTSLSVGGTFKISGDLEDNSVIDSGGVNTFVVLKNESQLERFSVTIAGGIATIVKRGLKKDWVTEDTNLQKIWWEGSIGYITPAPPDFIATGKLDTAGGLRNTMGTAQNIWATNGSTAITVADTTGWANGATITGTGIPGGTTIVSFVPNTSAVLSANFTGTTGTVSVIVWMRYALEIDNTLNEIKKAIILWSSFNPSDLIRKINPLWFYEDVPFSTLSWQLSWMTSEYIFGGTAAVNDSCYISELQKFKNQATPLLEIWKTVAKTTFKMYSSGNTEQRYVFFFTKTGTPQDLTFRIETDDGSGNASGTLVNANAVLVTAIASITTNAVYEIVLPASFNLWVAGTPIHFVFWQGSQYVNASNYLSIGINDEVVILHDRVTSPWSNLTATRITGSGAGTTTGGTWVQQLDANVDCQLMSLWFSYIPTTTLFEVFNVTDNISIYKDPITQTGITLNEPVQLLAGKRYELRYTFNNTLNNILSHNTVVNTANINWVNGTAGGNTITSIVTRTATFTENAGILFKYISKAIATTAIKAAVYAMLPQGASAWSYPSIVKDRYLWGFSNLIKWTTYYLSNTWVLSSTAWTVSKVLWVAIDSTTIRIDSAINIS